MNEFTNSEKCSVVSVIVPQTRIHHCLSEIMANWHHNPIQFDCRGTLVRQHRFQRLLPVINPECEFMQFLVNDNDVEDFMSFCTEVNDLHLPGSGAIFSAHCERLITNSTDIARSCESAVTRINSADVNKTYKSNLYAIYALIQSGRTEQAIKAAMQAGSHGPIVYFVEGRGTRDRAGWLKITKKPYEEVVMVLVEDLDRASVAEALVSAGRVNTFGGGVLFDQPLGRGLVNLPTSVGNRSQRSTNEQITAAIDELMGSNDWRNRRTLDALITRGQSQQADDQEKTERVLLNALIPRKNANEFLEHMLVIGVPGANVTYCKLFAGDDGANKKGIEIHHEVAQIRMVVEKPHAGEIEAELVKFATEREYKGVTLYEQPIGEVVRYQSKRSQQSLRAA
jgi:nitrogen regulatory protein PII